MPERLHPAAIAVYALHALRDAALPLVAILGVSVLGDGLDERALRRALLFGAIGTAGAALTGLMRWATTRYSAVDEVIRLRRGLLSTREVDVPFARVQSLDVEQGPVQRLFGVRSVRVQTAGGGAGGEIELSALSDADVARLRERVAGTAGLAAPAPSTGWPERRLGPARLLLAALTAGQLGVIVPVLAGLSQLFGDVVGEPPDQQQATRLLPHTAMGWLEAAGGLLLAAWVLSVLGAIAAFAGFRVARERGNLKVRRGVVARREVTLPVGRIRAVRVVEGLLRRPFGLATVRVEVLGFAKEPAAAQTLFPLLRRGDVRAFLDELLPELADDLDGLAPPPPRALRRYLLPPAVLALAAAVAGALALTPWALPLALAGPGYGWLRWRAAGWRLRDGRLAASSLGLARTTVLARAADRESHALAQTVLQRRGRLADVEVAFGRQTRARLHHIELEDARALWNAIR